MLSDSDNEYTYDVLNRNIKTITSDGNTQINRYDAEQLRYEMEENGRLTSFIYGEDRQAETEENETEGIKRHIRGFDTLQVIDEMYVPKTYGDKGPGLEPFTRCYPEYGKGGCQQFIYKGEIYFKNVDIIDD